MIKKLRMALYLNIGIVVSQFIGFLATKSVSLLGDMIHNLSDVLSIVISMIFHKKNSKTAKWINVGLLLLLVVFLGHEAYIGFVDPNITNSMIVILLAGISIVFNFFSVKLLHKHSHEFAHVRATYIHLLSDVLTSVAVLIGGIIMALTGWVIVDAIILCLIIIYLLYEIFKLVFREHVH